MALKVAEVMAGVMAEAAARAAAKGLVVVTELPLEKRLNRKFADIDRDGKREAKRTVPSDTH